MCSTYIFIRDSFTLFTYCILLTVVGYNQSKRVQTINEGVTSMLVVELLKPAVGVGQPSLIINFQIDNSANHGKYLHLNIACYKKTNFISFVFMDLC